MIEQELIRAHVLGKNRSWIMIHPEHTFTKAQNKIYQTLITRYENGEPLPYILGYKEFYGRKFFVNEHVLIPRPESELMIDIVKKITDHMKRPTIVDVGTGSGCLAITAKLEIPRATIHATDISNDALTIAQKNAKQHKTDILFYQGNLLEAVIPAQAGIHQEDNNQTKSFMLQDDVETIILANLPYIPTNEWEQLDPRVKNHEPHKALDGGKDGLDYYRKLFAQLPRKKMHVLCEIMPDQKDALSDVTKKAHPQAHIKIHNDLSGRPRVLQVEL